MSAAALARGASRFSLYPMHCNSIISGRRRRNIGVVDGNVCLRCYTFQFDLPIALVEGFTYVNRIRSRVWVSAVAPPSGPVRKYQGSPVRLNKITLYDVLNAVLALSSSHHQVRTFSHHLSTSAYTLGSFETFHSVEFHTHLTYSQRDKHPAIRRVTATLEISPYITKECLFFTPHTSVHLNRSAAPLNNHHLHRITPRRRRGRALQWRNDGVPFAKVW